MNEKFSELYHRAWTWAEFEDRYKDNPTYERRCVVALDLFAELIVKECASVAGYHYTRNECVSPHSIKKHFGVED